MRIIYAQDNGILAVLIPSPEFLAQLEGTETEKLIHVANKDLPTGTKYEIVADDYPPSDKSFRNAWEYVSGADEKTSSDLTAEDLTKYNMSENK
jgi:hypothetical protein|tara:strand:- start:306 stop:587 length:282 start_codon:yes stop_codon:yes gene_type:complete